MDHRFSRSIHTMNRDGFHSAGDNDRSRSQIRTCRNLGRANELAGALTIVKRHKLAAILEFLESVAFFSEDAARRDGENWMNGFVQRIRQEDV